MRVSLIKSDKISDLILPSKVKGNYWITDDDHLGNVRNLINVEAEKEKLQKQITDLELKARKEVQSKKKFEMVQRIQQYKERLKDMQ